MKINDLLPILSARVLTCPEKGGEEISTAYAGDMLSDVLALGSQPDILLTGLVNPQVIRTAEMLDTACVVFLRGKVPGDSVLDLARKCGVCVLSTQLEMYAACAALAGNGVKAAR